MPKLIVKNTCLVIEDYDFGQCQKMENYFRLFNLNTHSIYYEGIYYDKNNRRLYLPRGIDIWFVEKLLNVEAVVEVNQYDKFDKYDDMLIKYLPRDDVQKETLRFMLGKEEYRDTATKSQLSVNLNTGKGKTYVSIGTITYFGIKSIIITYSKEWLSQWKERIIEYTNITSREIFTITGSGSIYRLLNKSEDELKQYKIFLLTHATIKSYGDTVGWDKVTELFKILKIGIKIYDESHLNFTNMMMIDFFTNTFKTYYLTATKVRSSQDENRIYQMCFKNILAIDLFDAEEDPHTSYVAIKYNSKPSPMIISNCKNAYGLDRNKYTNYIVTNENFYKMFTIVLDIISSYIKDGKCLIYIGTNNAIQIVYEWIINNYPEYYNNIGIFTSLTEGVEKREALEKKIILSTTKSAGAAVDIKGLKATVVLAEPFKSEVIARQTLGRTRDSNTLYIEVVDKGFYYCNKYYYAKKSIFEKYATDCSDIDIGEEELNSRYNNIIKKRINMFIKPLVYVDKSNLQRPMFYRPMFYRPINYIGG